MNCLNSQLYRKNHIIAGFGNPLLDISAIVRSNTVLEKFNLKPDSQKEVNEYEINQILESLGSDGHEIVKSPGGCAQNTLRIIQALVKQPGYCVFFGGLGNDDDGRFVETEVKKSGVETRYAKHPTYATGKVAALINGDRRSLVAHLGAAEAFRLEDFKTAENLQLLEEILLVYIEGFFITHSFDVALGAIESCRLHGVIVVFNISGAYVADSHSEELLTMVTLADVVIGNYAEFKALARVIGIKFNTVKDLALKIHLFLFDRNTATRKYKLRQMDKLSKVVILTQGEDPVFCVFGDGELVEFSVPSLDGKLIKDTTGAGDSFAAAFLVAFIQDKSVTECLAYGCVVAQKVIQQMGVLMANED